MVDFGTSSEFFVQNSGDMLGIGFLVHGLGIGVRANKLSHMTAFGRVIQYEPFIEQVNLSMQVTNILKVAFRYYIWSM